MKSPWWNLANCWAGMTIIKGPETNSQRLSDWRGKAFRAPSTGQPTTEITDSRATELPRGSHVERLLIYTRPILEDGIIEYDFWYAAGKTHAHPARWVSPVSRRKPSGVEIHHATDGRYDRTKRRPDNRTKPSTVPTEFADRSNSVSANAVGGPGTRCGSRSRATR